MLEGGAIHGTPVIYYAENEQLLISMRLFNQQAVANAGTCTLYVIHRVKGNT